MIIEIVIVCLNLALWNGISTSVKHCYELNKLCLENCDRTMFWIMMGNLHEKMQIYDLNCDEHKNYCYIGIDFESNCIVIYAQ